MLTMIQQFTIALLLVALPAIAHAEPWSALMPGIALNPSPAPVDDPGVGQEKAPPPFENGASSNGLPSSNGPRPQGDSATTRAASQVALADGSRGTETIPPPAPQIGTSAAVVPPSTPDVPAAATNPAIPLDCARCARQVAGVVAPGKPWPVWATVTIVLVSGAMATLQALHDSGVLK